MPKPQPPNPLPPLSKRIKMGFWHHLVPKKHQKNSNKKEIVVLQRKNKSSKKNKEHLPMATTHSSPNDPILAPYLPPSKPTKVSFWHHLVPKKYQKTAKNSNKKEIVVLQRKNKLGKKKQKMPTHAQPPTDQAPPPPLSKPTKMGFWHHLVLKKHQK